MCNVKKGNKTIYGLGGEESTRYIIIIQATEKFDDNDQISSPTQQTKN